MRVIIPEKLEKKAIKENKVAAHRLVPKRKQDETRIKRLRLNILKNYGILYQ